LRRREKSSFSRVSSRRMVCRLHAHFKGCFPIDGVENRDCAWNRSVDCRKLTRDDKPEEEEEDCSCWDDLFSPLLC